MKPKWQNDWQITDGPSESPSGGTHCCNAKVPWYCVETMSIPRHVHFCVNCIPPYVLVLHGITKGDG